MRTVTMILLSMMIATIALAEPPFIERSLPPVPDSTHTWRYDSMVGGDVDGDGTNELVVAWSDVETATIHIVKTYHWNAGALRELSAIALSTLRSTVLLYLEDTDSDGQPELVTVEDAADAGSPMIIHEWDGSTWIAGWNQDFATIRRSNAVATGDLDGDGLNEIAVAEDWYGRSLTVIDYDDATGDYSITQTIGGNDFRSVDIADVDGDGMLEIIAGCGNWSYFDARVYRWTGSNYGLVWDSPTYGNCNAATVDYNGDGVRDLVISNWASSHVSGQNGLHIYDWQDTTFAYQYTLSADIPMAKPGAMDFDNDGIEDLVAMSLRFDELNAYSGDGLHFYSRAGGLLSDYNTIPGIFAGGGSAVGSCDVDNDGFNEVLVSDCDSDAGVTAYWFQHVADCPIISGIRDIPFDDGRQVRVDWIQAAADHAGAMAPIEQYRVWRAVKVGWKSADVERLATTDGIQYELVGSTPAMHWDTYSLIVPTLADSGEVEDPLWTFVVTAHLADGSNYFVSPAQQGYSIDQTAPSMPEGLNGFFADGDMHLTWSPVVASDLSHYVVYRAPHGSGPEVFLGSVETTSFVDAGVGGDVVNVEYRVAATDWTGNESERAVLDGGQTSGVGDDSIVPTSCASLKAYPNPFNPQTTVEFAVPSAGFVRLTAFDVRGCRVRELANEALSAGLYRITWDGRDDAGSRLSSGMYLLQMDVGQTRKTYQLMMVK